ncbi:hypothetical protein HHK36_031251 [Tetracentron sinense]|uniref:Aldehyde oxidase GLOX n=1 Tax=Tetracentron sinense TaxID=13715 RepID=A0A834YB67_TETSI|nr:hypothetical protein HHK36_031251 [Tetracentron sinense]
MSRTLILPFLVWLLVYISGSRIQAAGGGRWQILKESIGISAMHMQLLKNDRVIIFDRTDFGQSKLSLPNGKCRNDPNEIAIKIDCTAHSAEYNVLANSIRPLMVQTDVWCSSGAVSPHGNLVQLGGFNDGERAVRFFTPCSGCDWVENAFGLSAPRWYATNQILPDGRIIVIGGRQQQNYEFYPKSGPNKLFNLPFLYQTTDQKIENNLYPFVHLNVDGNLFIFANNRAILLDYKKNVVVRWYPEMPGGDPRNYPSTGSSVLLPLNNLQQSPIEAEVLVCGGAPKGSFLKALNGNFVKALSTCGRIKITAASPKWSMETMPLARVMGDMILLPNGNVLIINGASKGTAGWETGRNPALNPVIYRPDYQNGYRFELQNPSSIPRLYHSAAILLRDGRILVGGSNPHQFYAFTGVLYPTELSLEAFSPSYLDSDFSHLRPKIIAPDSQAQLKYGQRLVVRFLVTGALIEKRVMVTMVAPSFGTHSFSMNQRLLVLGGGKAPSLSKSTYEVEAMMPSSGTLAPSGYYLLFVVHQDIPNGVNCSSGEFDAVAVLETEKMESCVPPGFRFHPTDEELVGYYLKKKVASQKIDLDVIGDIDLYRIEPWDLQERCRIGYEEQNEWYFFSHKDKKYPTGTRTNRATMAGFWKATGRDKAVYEKMRLIGMRKTLVFYKGRAPNGQKSDWIMHEYRLESEENGPPQARTLPSH